MSRPFSRLIAAATGLLCLGLVLAWSSGTDAAFVGSRRALLGGVPGWVLPGASIDLDFATGQYYGGSLSSLLSISRAWTETSLLPSSAAGTPYLTFGNNALAIVPGLGLQIYEARTNVLLNSAAPVTQTTGSLATGSWTLWVNGSGSATSSAGTATGTGFGTATNGVPNTFSLSVGGTVTITVSGSLNAFQLEAGSFGTPLIVTTSSSATRAADNVTATGALLAWLKGTNLSGYFFLAGVQNASSVRYLASNADLNYLLAPTATGTTISTTMNGHVLNATLGSGTVATQTKIALGVNGTGRSLVVNNGTIATDGFTPMAATSFTIGAGSGNLYVNDYLERLTVWTTRLSDTTLKALTQ